MKEKGCYSINDKGERGQVLTRKLFAGQWGVGACRDGDGRLCWVWCRRTEQNTRKLRPLWHMFQRDPPIRQNTCDR